jgi:hypothetical protein
VQIVPEMTQPPAPLVGFAWQVPSVLGALITQFCVQQSVFFAQTSLFWWQYDEAVEQTLPGEHSPEQQSPLTLQGLPELLQPDPGLSTPHVVPPLQVPLQHCPFIVQACPSAVHIVEHLPLTQLRLQQSVPSEQLALFAAHVGGWVHLLVARSQDPEQQSTFFVQACWYSPQDCAQVLLAGSQMPEQQSEPTAQAAAKLAQLSMMPSVPPSPPSVMSPVGSPQPPQRMNKKRLIVQIQWIRVWVFVRFIGMFLEQGKDHTG